MKKSHTIKLEMYHMNELPSSWEKDLDPTTLQKELQELEESDKEILKQYAPADMAAAIRKKIEKEQTGQRGNAENEIPFRKPNRRFRRFHTTILLPVAAAILFALFLPTMIYRNRTELGPEITRVKGLGEPELKVYRNLGEETEVMKDYSTAEESDLIQLGYRVSSEVYGMIISIDGRGIVTRHLPEREEKATLLQAGGEHLLPFSYELDDAPQYETFYLITSNKPFPLDPVIDAVTSAARKNGMVLNIPDVVKKNGFRTDTIGRIHQYAVPIKKED